MDNSIQTYLDKINDIIKNDSNYDALVTAIRRGDSHCEAIQKINKKHFDLSWVDEIEKALIAIDTIVRNPRKFISVEEDIIDISLAKQISSESVKHLATHTNLISSVEGDKVIPSKILNISKEESYEIYENRFIFTLLQKLNEFVAKRYQMVKKAVINDNQSEVSMDSLYEVNDTQLAFRLDTVVNLSLDEVTNYETQDDTVYERVARIHSIVNGFMQSPFMKELHSCSPVRPPITHTNIIKKDPNFKIALKLWDFLWTYDKPGFEVEPIIKEQQFDEDGLKKYETLVVLNHLIMEDLITKHANNTEMAVKQVDNPIFLANSVKDASKIYIDRLDLFLIKKEQALRSYVQNKLNDFKNHQANLKQKKSIKILNIFEKLVLDSDKANYLKTYQEEINNLYQNLTKEEYKEYDLEVIKNEYNYRLTHLLDNTFLYLTKLCEV